MLAAVFIVPLVWMVLTSVKTYSTAQQSPPTWLPNPVSGYGYDRLFQPGSQNPVLLWFVNSMAAATMQAALVLVTASTAAYALARMRFAGRRLMFAVIVATLFVPPATLIIPNFLIADTLNWLDTLAVVVVPGAASAFGVFFLRQFFLTLPHELEEAAILDGANQWQVFLRVVLPLSKPALATLTVLSFLTNWNDFLWPIYTLFSPEKQTLPAGLSTLQSANSVRYDLLMAGAMISAVPVLILYAFTQRFIVEGIASAGMKD